MPDLTVTLSDAQLNRLTSSGIFDTRNDAGEVTTTTQAVIEAWLSAQLKAAVLNSQLSSVSETAKSERRTVLASEGW